MKRRFKNLKKNAKALQQANITPVQMLNIRKEAALWWRITLNLKAIEGTWPKVLRTYVKMFEGVAGKKER